MASGSLYTLIIFIFLMIGFMVALGATTPQLQAYIITPINTLQSGFPPAPQPPVVNNSTQTGNTTVCLINIAGFQMGCVNVPKGSPFDLVGQWMGFLVNLIGWFVLLVLKIFIDLGALIFLIVGITTFLNTILAGTFFQYFWDGLIVITLIDLVALARGTGP